MSDVLIKGMEMPKDDYVVMTLYPNGNCYLYYKGCGGIAKTAKVIEVPPHGRLIDADALKQKKKHSTEFAENVVSVAEIDWMPTIIEAEGT